jgi:hypothetical protein
MTKKYSKKEVEKMDEELQAMVEDSDRLHDLKAVLNQKGGQILVDALMADVVASVDFLSNSYKTISHAEIMAHCASLQVNLNLVRALKGAVIGAKEVDKIIKEELEKP